MCQTEWAGEYETLRELADNRIVQKNEKQYDLMVMHDQLVNVTTTGKTPELIHCPKLNDVERISTDWVIDKFIPYLMDLRRSVCANAQNFVGQQRKMAITHWLHACICTTDSQKLRLIANTGMQKHADEPEAFLLYFAGELECGDKEQLGTSAINSWKGAARMTSCESAFNQLILLVQMVQVVHLMGINGTIVTACRRFAQQNDIILAIVSANYGNVAYRCPDGTVLSACSAQTPPFLYWMALLADALRSFKRAHGLELECIATRDFGRFSMGVKAGVQPKEVSDAVRLRQRKRTTSAEPRQDFPREPFHKPFNVPRHHNNHGSNDSFKRPRDATSVSELEIPRKVRQVIEQKTEEPPAERPKDVYGEAPPSKNTGHEGGASSAKQQVIFHNGAYWAPIANEVCFVHFDSHNQAETLIAPSLLPYIRDLETTNYNVKGFAGDEEFNCNMKGRVSLLAKMDDGGWDPINISGYVCPKLDHHEIILSRKALPDTVNIGAGIQDTCQAFIKGYDKAISLPYDLTARMIPIRHQATGQTTLHSTAPQPTESHKLRKIGSGGEDETVCEGAVRNFMKEVGISSRGIGEGRSDTTHRLLERIHRYVGHASPSTMQKAFKAYNVSIPLSYLTNVQHNCPGCLSSRKNQSKYRLIDSRSDLITCYVDITEPKSVKGFQGAKYIIVFVEDGDESVYVEV